MVHFTCESFVQERKHTVSNGRTIRVYTKYIERVSDTHKRRHDDRKILSDTMDKICILSSLCKRKLLHTFSMYKRVVVDILNKTSCPENKDELLVLRSLTNRSFYTQVLTLR